MSHKDEGLAALRAGDMKTAVERLQWAVQEVPDGQSWAGLGVALCQLGRSAEGIRALEQAISAAPNQAAFHYNLGRALEMQGRAADALKAYQRTASLDPNHQLAQEAARRLSAAAPLPAAPSEALPTATAVAVPPPPPAPAPNPASEFILTPTAAPGPPPTASGWANGVPLPPPPPTMGGYAAGSRPSTMPPMVPVGYPGAPAAIGTPGGRPLPPPAPVSSGFPWVAVILGVCGVGCAGVIILAAVLFPVFAQARKAALRARQRAIAASGGTDHPWPSSAEEADGTSPFSVSGSAPREPGVRPITAGPDLNSTAPGPKISDRRDAFSVTLPAGFRSALPMPGMLPLGMAGMGRTASYNSRTGALECQVLCLTFPPSQFDLLTPAETFGRIRDRLPASLHARLTRTQQGNFQGNPSEDDRMEGGMTGQHFIRSRMIWSKPRILLLLFSSNQEADLDRPAANHYFESLEIGENVDTRGLSEPVRIPEPRLIAPPPMPTPTIPQPRFVPPPTPHFTPPASQFGTPNGAYPPDGSPSGATDPNASGPGGPSFGPRFGPRFRPRFQPPTFGPRFGLPGNVPDPGAGGSPANSGGAPAGAGA